MSEINYENIGGKRLLVLSDYPPSLCEIKILEVSEQAVKIEHASGFEQWYFKTDFELKYTIAEYLPETPKRDIFDRSPRARMQRKIIS